MFLVWLSRAGILHPGFSKNLILGLKIKLLANLQNKQNILIALRICGVVGSMQLALCIRSIWKSHNLPPHPLPKGHSLLSSLFNVCKSSTFYSIIHSICCEIVLSVQLSSPGNIFFLLMILLLLDSRVIKLPLQNPYVQNLLYWRFIHSKGDYFLSKTISYVI